MNIIIGNAIKNFSFSSEPTTVGTPTTFGGQVFPPTSFGNFFGNKDGTTTGTFPGFTGSVTPIQPINPDFFTSAQKIQGLTNFPQVTRTVVPTTTGTTNGFPTTFPTTTGTTTGFQTGFPTTGGVLGTVGNGIGGQVFPGVGGGAVPTVQGIPGFQGVQGLTGGYQGLTGLTGFQGLPTVQGTPTGGIGGNTNTGIGGVQYRLLTPETITGFGGQGIQGIQGLQGLQGLQGVQPIVQGGLTGLPTYTGGLLQTIPSGVLTGGQGVLKNTNIGVPQGITNIGTGTGNLPAGALATVFRHA